MATQFIPVEAHELKRGDKVWNPDSWAYPGARGISHPLDSHLLVLYVETHKPLLEGWEPDTTIKVGNPDGSMSSLRSKPNEIYVRMETV